ncbi:hypothetical protein RHIZ404_180066 [Rhizobium sp. EC-SD404]|nr:hypothetical protein RHIZ404_180066 [Rhizobium sp. EC-SD404]
MRELQANLAIYQRDFFASFNLDLLCARGVRLTAEPRLLSEAHKLDRHFPCTAFIFEVDAAAMK